MYPISIILFFLYSWGFGLGIGLFVKEAEDFFERNLMRIGIGLGAMLTFGLLLNLIKVPLDWKIFLVISLVPILISIFKSLKSRSSFSEKLKGIKINVYALIVLALFSITLYMYAKGAFSYPYLEDDDSWSHAMGVKYVAVQKTVFDTPANVLHYIDPYPPLYDMLIGILHQTNNSVYWTLKFFNALVISLSIIFFYFFAKEFTKSPKKALFSTFALFSVPAFMSHFIWALSLAVPLYFVAFYSLEKIKDDKRWAFASVPIIASILTISPTHSTFFGLLFSIYLVIKILAEKRFLAYEAIVGASGLALSFALWWLPMILKHGVEGTLRGIGLYASESILSVGGTGDRVYSIADFLCSFNTPCYKGSNMINNPIGIGMVVSFLAISSLIFLVYRYYSELKKYKMQVLAVFLILAAIMLFALSGTYTKYVEKKNVKALESGSVPFFEFLSDQFFLASVLMLMLFVFVLMLIINYKDTEFREKYILIALAWLIFGFYAVNAGPFYFKLSPFRSWIILAIPVAFFAGEAIWSFSSFFRKISLIKFLVVGIIVIGVIATSFSQKYLVNTSQWPPGGFWASMEEINGYVWLKESLPKNSNVFTFVNNGPVIGMDMYTCHWCENIREYQKNGFNQSAEQNYAWLKREKYEYLAIDSQTIKKFGAEESNNKIKEMINSAKFKPVHSNNGIIIFKMA